MSSTYGTITRTDDGFTVYYPSDAVRQQQRQDTHLGYRLPDFNTTDINPSNKTAQTVPVSNKTVETKPVNPHERPIAPGVTIDTHALLGVGGAVFLTIVLYTILLFAIFKGMLHLLGGLVHHT
jgi:hypothetical protein